MKRDVSLNKIVVDSNIIFSALLNTNNTFGKILFKSDHIFEFCSNSFMRYEIEKHWAKLKRISGFNESELQELRIQIFSKLNFINEEIIPEKIWLKARKLVVDIDIDDVDFVALTLYLKAKLWTGDKELIRGLKAKKFKHIIDTTEMSNLFDKLERKKR